MKRRLEALLAEIVEHAFEKALAQLRTGHGDDPDPFAFVTNDKAMKLLGLSRSTLAEYRRTGLLPFAKLGSSDYFGRSDIEDFLEARVIDRKGGGQGR